MKTKRKILFAIGLVLIGIGIYYLIVIINARIKTPEIVRQALHSERIKLQLSDLTKQQLDALIKVQDPEFYHHKGFDISTPGAGITTISQGLVKIYYFEDFQPGIAKIKQTLIARFAFDPLTPKDTILKLFINDAYLGQRKGKQIHGFEDASEFYFKKKFKDLSWDEYLSLIAMIRAPFTYHYIKQKEANSLRVERIKRYLSGEYIPVDNSDWLYNKR